MVATLVIAVIAAIAVSSPVAGIAVACRSVAGEDREADSSKTSAPAPDRVGVGGDDIDHRGSTLEPEPEGPEPEM